MDIRFDHKVVLVTGASSGIGKKTAKMFAESGATVILAARREDRLKKIVDDIIDAGQSAAYIVCDVTDEDQVKHMIDRIDQDYGKLDYAFNNAGVMADDVETANVSLSDFDRVLNVNLRSVFISMKYELQEMLKQDEHIERAIVNCSSIGGLVGMPGRSAYHASKHAVIGLTKSSALEYATRHIRINAVCPGTIETPMVSRMKETGAIKDVIEPIGRVGRPEEVGSAVLWLCSNGAGYVTGQAIPVDGGYTIQ